MTEPHTRRIAELAIKVHDTTADLRVSEQTGAYKQARIFRQALADAQAALDQAIAEACER